MDVLVRFDQRGYTIAGSTRRSFDISTGPSVIMGSVAVGIGNLREPCEAAARAGWDGVDGGGEIRIDERGVVRAV